MVNIELGRVKHPLSISGYYICKCTNAHTTVRTPHVENVQSTYSKLGHI